MMLSMTASQRMSVSRQQNYMSVLVKEKQTNYNQSQFYRANPFVNQGYIPTSSLKNRKQPQFITEIPQGINYFEPSAKKHFTQITKKTAIVEENLLTNPEKYPYQNRIANDIHFHRNLNTIDIEGTHANSKKSKAMKNRIKAQEELKRRNAKIITPILWEGLSQEEIRRKLAEEQLAKVISREKQSSGMARKYNSQTKLPPAEHYAHGSYKEIRDEGAQFNMEALQKFLSQKQKNKELQVYFNLETPKQSVTKSTQPNKRYQSSQNLNKIAQSKPLSNDLQYQIQSTGSGYVPPPSVASTNLNNEIRQYFQKERMHKQKDIRSQQYKQQFRQLNPTNLSYQGAIVKSSSIFANLGKNLALN